MVDDIASVIEFLAPLVPWLSRSGEAAAEEAGKKAAGDMWATAKRLWQRLSKDQGSMTTEPSTASPDSNETAAELRRLLAARPALAQELVRMFNVARPQSTGSARQFVAANVTKSNVIVGDGNAIVDHPGDRNYEDKPH